MKKLLMFLGLIGFIFFAGCEEIVEQKKDCDVNSYGSVVITNKTGYIIYVDVTWGSDEYNDERQVRNNGSTTYQRVPAGSVVLWAKIKGDSDWYRRGSHLSKCGELKESWYVSNSASMSSIVILDSNLMIKK